MVKVRLIVTANSIIHHLEILCIGRLDIKACEGTNTMVKGHQQGIDGVLQPGTFADSVLHWQLLLP